MLNEELTELLERQKALLSEDRRKLGLLKSIEVKDQNDPDEEGPEVVRESGSRKDETGNDENLNVSHCSDGVDGENKENLDFGNVSSEKREVIEAKKRLKPCPVEQLDLDNLNYNEKKKRDFVDQVASSDSPFMSRSDDRRIAMLRYGEYSPNNPELRTVHAQPFLGIGEYEQQQNLLRERRKGQQLNCGTPNSKPKRGDFLKDIRGNILPEKYSRLLSKVTQTDIQNINCLLIQYDRRNPNEAQKELSPQRVVTTTQTDTTPNNRELQSYRRTEDQNLTSFGNGSVNRVMDKPKGILTNRKSGSPRDRFMSNLKHSYTPSFMDGFSYSDRTEELEREKKKREAYNYELRMQIEEKRRMQAIKDDQDRREQELENRRLEQQLLRMQEEALVDDPKSSREEQVRKHSEDYLRRRTDLGMRPGYRKHSDSESSVYGARNALSHYSPPVSRRTPFSLNTTVPQTSAYTDPITSRYNPHPSRYDYDSSLRSRRDALNRMDSLNVYDTLSYDANNAYDTASRYKKNAAFARFDSLSRIDSLTAARSNDPLYKFDSLNLQDNDYACGRSPSRRHSATHQDFARRSPKLQRRSNSGRLDDQALLPLPVLKARSPVARELKNSVPFNSSTRCSGSSEACRKLEDKWQIPAVQKTIVNHSDSLRDGPNRSILTQLGAIRMQLQQEQLRMDESLRKRGITQSKAVDFH